MQSTDSLQVRLANALKKEKNDSVNLQSNGTDAMISRLANAFKQERAEKLYEKQLEQQAKLDYYNSLKQNSDWEEKSKISAVDSLLGEIKNFSMGSMSREDAKRAQKATFAKNMDEEQAAIYNYLYQTDKQKAEEYYKDLEKGLSQSFVDDLKEQARKYADENELLGSVASVGTNFLSVGDGLGNLIEGGVNAIKGNGFTFDTTNDYMTHLTNSYREGASADMGAVGKFLYGTGMSMLDNIARAPFGAVGAGIMAMGQAASQGMVQGKEMGMSDWKAALYGIGVGAIEGLTEVVSVDKLLDKTSLAKSVKGYILKNVIAEGFEEGTSELADKAYQMLLAGDEAEWRKEYQAYISQGHSKAEAIGLVVANTIGDVGLASLSGAVSGGAMAGGSIGLNTAINTPKNIALGREVSRGANATGELLNAAEALKSKKIDNTARKMANAKEGGLRQDYLRGKLTNQVMAEAYEKLHPYGDETETKRNDKPTHDAKVAQKKLTKENKKRTANGQQTIAEEFEQSDFGQKYNTFKEKIKTYEDNQLAKNVAAMQGKINAEQKDAYNVSEDGKTYLIEKNEQGKATLKEAEVAEFAGVKEGVAQVKLSDGSVVSATDMSLPVDVAKQYRYAASYNDTAVAKAFIDGYSNYNGTIEAYAEEVKTAYALGKEAGDRGISEMINTLPKTKQKDIINNPVTATAFDAGKARAKKQAEDAVKMKKARDAKKSRFDGGVERASEDKYSSVSTNEKILALIDKVKGQEHKQNEKIYFDTVSIESAKKIFELTGIDVTGFKVAIEARQLEHILKEHGENGRTDNSMSNDEDVAKMEYVIENPDSIVLAGRTQAYSYMKNGYNRTAQTVLYEKDIGDKSYYVVQAVPDTQAKTLYLVSAFIGEKGYKKMESHSSSMKNPDATSNNGSVVTPTDSISEKSEKVNTSDKKTSESNGKIAKKRSKGSFTISSEVDMNSLNATQKAAIKRLEVLSNCLGNVSIEVISDPANAEGVYESDNGKYDPNTNTISIDINAGKEKVDGMCDYALVETLSHEVVHFVKEHSPQDYENLKSFLQENVYTSVQWNELVPGRLEQYRVGNPEFTYEAAEEEVVANACQTMLNSPRVLAALAKNNYSLVARIKIRIADFFDNLISKLGSYVNYTSEARIVLMSTQKMQRTLEKKFVEAVRQARSNSQSSTESTKNSEAENKTVKASLRENDSIAKITSSMTEEARADILSHQKIKVTEIKQMAIEDIDWNALEHNRKSAVEKHLIKRLRELGCLKTYQTDVIDVVFDFTGGGLKKSLNSQVTSYGGSLADLTKVVLNMQTLLDNSVLIEIHEDKKKGNNEDNTRLLRVFVLFSAFAENQHITPVQFEVKQFVDNNNRLYLAVALTKIETSVVGDTALQREERTRLIPVSNISIPDLIKKINPKDENFFKYIPDEFLNESQLEAKHRALEKDNKKYGRNEIKSSKRERSETYTREEIAKAFESIAETTKEKRIVQQYKDNLAKQNACVEERRRLLQELNELRGKKGSEAASKRSELNIQIKNKTKQIFNYDEQLFNLQNAKPLKKAAKNYFDSQIEDKHLAEEMYYHHLMQKLKDKHKKELDEAKEKLQAEKKKHAATKEKFDAERASSKEKHKSEIESEKQRRKSELDEAKEKLQKLREDYRERKSTAKDKQRINKIYKKNVDMLNKPDNKHFVPQYLIEHMANLLELLRFDSGIEGEAQTKRNEIVQTLRNFADAYSKLKNEELADYNQEYDESIAEYFKSLADVIEASGTNNVYEMDPETLHDVADLLVAVDISMREARNSILDEGKNTIKGIVQTVVKEQAEIAEIQGRSTEKDPSFMGKVVQTVESAGEHVASKMLSPMSVAKKISGYNEDNQFYKLIQRFNDGKKKAAWFSMKSHKLFEELTTGENRKTFEKSKTELIDIGLRDKNGNVIYVTKQIGMQFLLSVEREESNSKINHIFNKYGGLLIPDANLLAKGNEQAAWEHGKKVIPTQENVQKMKDMLTEWDKQYMEVARVFFNQFAKDEVNATSLLVSHYEIATETAYIPFVVDSNQLEKEVGSTREAERRLISSYGFTKTLTEKAPQRLKMAGLNAVMEEHIDSVSKYSGFAAAVKDLNKVLKSRVSEDSADTVQDYLIEKVGHKSFKVLFDAFVDVQSPRKTERNFFTWLQSRFVPAKLVMNLGTVLKQYSSIYNANAKLGNRWGTTTFSWLKTSWLPNYDAICAEIDEHTAAHWERRQGLSLTEVGDLKTNKNGHAKVLEWGIPIGKKGRKLNGMTAVNLIQHVDCVTAATIWQLTKEKIQKDGKYEKDSPEYWNAVTKLFEETLNETQSTYDVFNRPEVLKGSGFIKAVTLFTTEEFKRMSILFDAVGKYKYARKKGDAELKSTAGRELRRAIIALLRSTLSFVIIQTLVNILLFRTDDFLGDDGEFSASKTLGSLSELALEQIGGTIFPIIGSTAVELVSDIVTGDFYYKNNYISAPTLDFLNQVLQSYASLGKGFDDTEKYLGKLWNSAALTTEALFGIPMLNFEKLVEAIKKWIEAIFE